MRIVASLTLSLVFLSAAVAQETKPQTSSQVIVPHLVRFSGQIKDGSGTVGITFTLHISQNDNSALWVETQNVALDAAGKYTVLLGATKSEGLPVELFTSGEAQWLGIHVQGQAEQPRVLLVSVPYALKAAEAETLAGHAASDFVTSDKVTTIVQQQIQTSKENPAPVHNTTAPVAAGPTQFTGNTTTNVVSVVQSGTGTGLTAVAPGTAVYGSSSNTSGNAYGVKGASASSSGFGVYGLNTATTGSAVGIYGQSSSNAGVALSGLETSTTGTTKGIVAAVNSANGTGLVVQNTAANGKLISGQSGSTHTEVFSIGGTGHLAIGNDTSGFSSMLSVTDSGNQHVANILTSDSAEVGLYAASSYIPIWGQGGLYGVYAEGTSAGGYGVLGYNAAGTGIRGGNSNTTYPSAYLLNQAGSGTTGVALLAISGSGTTSDFTNYSYGNGYAAAGEFDGPNGVIGYGSSDSDQGYGVTGVNFGSSGRGINGYNHGTNGIAVYGADLSDGKGTSYGGYFVGNVQATGTVTGAAARMTVDDPTNPAESYLTHAAVVSPEMKTMYDGSVTLGENGEAEVQLPAYFEALNENFHYQLTCIGGYAPVYVAQKIANNRFRIAGGHAGMEVSWMVTGVRRDAYAKMNPLEVQKAKAPEDRGRYMNPAAFGATAEQRVGARDQKRTHTLAVEKWAPPAVHPAQP